MLYNKVTTNIKERKITLIKDYHTHPQILQKPELFKDFAKVAIKNGVQEICVTDHMPLSCCNASDRIPAGKVSEYCFRVRELAEQYKGTLSIKCGIEIDYHPTILNEIEAVLKAGDFDYVLGSSHLHAIKPLNIFEKAETQNNYAKLMFENTISAAESGYFNAIAHIDMHKWIFSKPELFPLVNDGYSPANHCELIDNTLEAIKKNNLKLEINPHFAVSNNNPNTVYPDAYIVEKALSKNISFCYGSDAHVAEDVGIMLNLLRENKVYGKAIKNWEE